MGNRRYKKLERFLTILLCADTIAFILYLVYAGMGITGAKVGLSILCIAASAYILWVLYASKEMGKQRSLWITLGASAIIVCLFFSLILGYPYPK